MNVPQTLSNSLHSIDQSKLSDSGKAFYQKILDRGFDIKFELDETAAKQIIKLSLEPAIKEFCPNDSGKRFKDIDSLKQWISKGRIVVLLTKQVDNNTEVVGYGWVGEGESMYVETGKATFAIRIGEAGQGQGLGTPFAALIVEVAASEYGINLVWIGEKAPSATSVTSKYVFDMGNKMDIIFEGIVTKNPAIALKLAEDFIIGVFEMEQDTLFFL